MSPVRESSRRALAFALAATILVSMAAPAFAASAPSAMLTTSAGPASTRLATLSPGSLPDTGTASPLFTGPQTSGFVTASLCATDPQLANAVWSLPLTAGQEVNFVATCPGDNDVDVLLFGPNTSSIYSGSPIAHSTFYDYWPDPGKRSQYYPEHLSFVAPASGTYYVDLWCKLSAAPQTARLDWAIWTARPDDRAPGASVSSPRSGTLDELTNPDDFFVMPSFGANEQLRISASSSDIQNLYGALWNPLYRVDPDLSNAYSSQTAGGSSVEFAIDYDPSNPPPQPMWLQLQAFEGSGTYQLEFGVRHQATVNLLPAGDIVVPYGGAGHLWGTVIDKMTSAVASGVPVILYASAGDGAWSTAASTTTDSSGHYDFWPTPDVAMAYYTSTGKHPVIGYAEFPGAVWIVPKAFLSVPWAPASVKRGAKFTSAGFLKPHHATGTVAVRIYKERYASGKWVSAGYVNVKVSDYLDYSRYAATTSLPSSGKWRIRAYHDDADHATTWTGYRYITVK